MQKSGVGYYTYNLINALQRVDLKNEYTLLFWKLRGAKKIGAIKVEAKNFKLKAIRFPYHLFYKLYKFGLGIPLNLFVRAHDLTLFTNFVRFPVFNSKSVVIIYDLSYIKYSQYADTKNFAFLTKFVPLSIKESDHIITISESSKKEIMSYYKVPEEKTSIINPAIDKNFFKISSPKEINKIKQKYKINKNYFLFTSTLEPRKNIIGIVKSYLSLPQEIKKNYDLVLTGGQGWKDEELLQEIKKAQDAGDKIIQTGYVLEEDLPPLYSGATLFLYPSFYEGFGIPILEAMACGVPVIASRKYSMPEVGGDAALYVNDPKDIDEIKSNILKIINNEDIKKEMVKKGFEQIKKFSWEESARKLVKVFEKVYRG